MSILTKIKQWYSSKGKDASQIKESIVVHDDGFIVRKDDARIDIKWREVKQVFTYKVDCWGYDVIRLAFETSDLETTVHVSEDAEHFSELMCAFTGAFPEIDPEWYQKVMQPPFAENFTVLFKRKI